jgi:hypothetical protein
VVVNTALYEQRLAELTDDDRDGATEDQGDCDDGDAASFPGAAEVCDGADNDCNGLVDDDPPDSTWYEDHDGDGWGDDATAVATCSPDAGQVSTGGDCDDRDAAVSPGEEERCNGVDDDCDGEEDLDAADAATWYPDWDGDGWGDASAPTTACEAPAGTVSEAGDCDDGDAAVNPDEAEVCDAADADEDCDGLADDEDDDVTGRSTWYIDYDGDGYGVDDYTVVACDQPEGYAPTADDCDDRDGRYHPGAEEADCTDPEDYDCDGEVAWADADGDGWAACEDCDDHDDDVAPDQAEVCNGVDDDCDGSTDSGAVDADTWFADTDGDGFGDAASSIEACDPPDPES